MSFRVITICLENSVSAEQLTSVAAGIAGEESAYIQTVHVLPAGYEYVAISPYVQGVPMARLYDQYEKIADGIKKSYLACQDRHSGNLSWNWHQYDGFTLSDFEPYVNHAMVSDLVICSKPPNMTLGAALPRTLVRESATPVLVVPDGLELNVPFERITIAWNETPESARAIRDSLPLLKRAREVYLLTVTKNDSDDTVKGVDIGRYLAEHGINIEIDQTTSVNQIGEELLNHVKTSFSDLLVMGGFGHSSIYNMLLGSATPLVLKRLTCPVFMSH